MAKKETDGEEQVIRTDVDFNTEGQVLEIRVHKCRGKLHRVGVDRKGGKDILVLHDHDQKEVESEETLARLGGRPCPCVALYLWEKHSAEAAQSGQ